MKTWRIAIIGGGLSGLASAHRVLELGKESGTPIELTLFEAGPRLGGVMGTREVGGYRVETGADSFITNKPWAIDLCRRLGLEGRLTPTDAAFRRSLVLRSGKPLEVPEGFQLLAPMKVGVVLRSPIFSPWGKLRLALEYFMPRGEVNEDESLAHFVRRRFGREALERLVQPLVGGIYTSDPEKLSLRATMPRFLEMEREHGSVIRAMKRAAKPQATKDTSVDETASGARYGLFATLAGGISELLDALIQRVSAAATIRLNTPVVSVTPASGQWSVVSGQNSQSTGVAGVESAKPQNQTASQMASNADGKTVPPDYVTGSGVSRCSTPATHAVPESTDHCYFDAVILAVPAYRAAELIGGFASEAAAALARIEYASTAIVVSGHKLSDIRHPLDAFGLVVPTIEKRNILAVSFTSRKFLGRAPAGCVQLRTFVGGAMQPELLQLSDGEILTLVRRELAEILGVSGTPDFEIVTRWNRAMPQYHVGHLNLVAEIERALENYPGLALAGNAYHGVGIPDCIHSGELAADRVCGGMRLEG